VLALVLDEQASEPPELLGSPGLRGSAWIIRLTFVVAALLAAELATSLGIALLGRGRPALVAERAIILLSAAEREGEATVGPAPRAAALLAETQSAQIVLHPYLGYVLNPEIKLWRTPRGRIVAPQITEDGFEATPDPPATASQDDIEVGLFGGSVATLMCDQGRTTLLNALAKVPRLQHKRIALRCFALGGYKQPQQLMALAYFLTVGGKLDIVINLDGFNDVALPFAENWPNGVFPFYPRGWTTLVEGIPDIKRLRLVGSIVDIEDRRVRLARTFSSAPLRWSAICNLLWEALDRNLGAKLAETQMALQRSGTADRGSYLGHGPRRQYGSEDKFFEDLAAGWKRGSLEMAHLCAGAGIRYYHFLQPNQYDPGSKPMGAEERRTAYNPNHPYRKGVEHGYPLLAKAGLELVADGIKFYDARKVFAGLSEPLYVDQCCHFKPKGSQILAAWMAARIVQDFGSAPLAADDALSLGRREGTHTPPRASALGFATPADKRRLVSVTGGDKTPPGAGE
jgi:hypothetical protein